MLVFAALFFAAPVPEHLDKAKPPEVRYLGALQRGNHVYLRFEVLNPNAADLHYLGYTSDSIDGGLKAGVISPMYRVETRMGKDWKAFHQGWCGTGLGPVTVPARGKATFEASAPTGEWTEARIGLVWYTAPDRKTMDVAWGVVRRAEVTPPK